MKESDKQAYFKEAEEEAQKFTISYDYVDKKIGNFGMSPAIKKVIIANGYDPFNK